MSDHAAAKPWLCETHGVLVYEGGCPDCRPPVPSRWRWFRWRFGDLVGRWISPRLGGLIEGESW